MMTFYQHTRNVPAVRLLTVILPAIVLLACASSDIVQNLTAEDRFALGKKKFDDGDYLEAINDFNVIKLQFPGSSVADDAQFYLGECHYNQDDFLIASEEFQTLKRSMPASPLVPMAQYKTALCFYNLSPPSSLDQRHTTRAIDEFQTFIEYYPTHELVHDAESKIVELNNRLARKLYDSGVLYLKMEYYKASTIYFNSVIDRYHDTQFAEPAYIGKARALNARKKYAEANEELEKFLQKFPNSSLKDDALALQREVQAHLKPPSSALAPLKP